MTASALIEYVATTNAANIWVAVVLRALFEHAAAALGKNVLRLRMTAFVAGGVIAREGLDFPDRSTNV